MIIRAGLILALGHLCFISPALALEAAPHCGNTKLLGFFKVPASLVSIQEFPDFTPAPAEESTVDLLTLPDTTPFWAEQIQNVTCEIEAIVDDFPELISTLPIGFTILADRGIDGFTNEGVYLSIGALRFIGVAQHELAHLAFDAVAASMADYLHEFGRPELVWVKNPKYAKRPAIGHPLWEMLPDAYQLARGLNGSPLRPPSPGIHLNGTNLLMPVQRSREVESLKRISEPLALLYAARPLSEDQPDPHAWGSIIHSMIYELQLADARRTPGRRGLLKSGVFANREI